MSNTLERPPLGLYVHLPWCVRKCPYCDFNSHALRGEAPYDEYTTALLRDADAEAARAGSRPVESIFIGGGTPSLFPPEQVQALLEGLDRRLTLSADCEITLEANPGTVELARFRGFRDAGVNRLSIGVQTFDPGQLHALGRIHSGAEADRAADAARDAGFERFNLDLMFALPGQTADQAVADVDRALSLGARHISHYQLTLEPGTAFHERPPVLPDDDTAAAMQAACARHLAAGGLRRYEVSAWAVAGEECRHNLNYWQFGDYLAIGAGAHGKLTHPERDAIERYSKQRLPRAFMAAAGSEAVVAEHTWVAREERALEYMMNALRLTHGAPRDQLTRRTGLDWSAFAAPLAAAETRGLVEVDERRVRPSERGIEFLNEALSHFL